MDYSKQEVSKKKKNLSSKKKRRHPFFAAFKIILWAIIGIGCIGMCCCFGLINGALASAPSVDSIDISPSGYATTVYDNNGRELTQLVSSGSNRVYVTIDEIPECLQHAFVAIEDSRFYDHNGIDYKGIARAAFIGITHGFHFSEGASTITQQLLKNNVFTTWTSESSFGDKLKRKIQEQYLAVQLEKVTDKSTILENYLNTINLGQNTLGVQAAANRYFDKDVSELTISESAVIAAITQNPTAYNPVTYPENNKERRAKVLSNMLEQGYISDSEYNEALADDVYSCIQDVNSNTETSIYSYFVDELIEQVINDLQEQKGYSESQAYKLLYSGGLSIYTTQDSDIQAICDEEYQKSSNYPENTQWSFTLSITIEHSDGTYSYYDEQSMLSYLKSNVSSTSNLVYSSKKAAKKDIRSYEKALLGDGDSIPENGEVIHYTAQPQASLVIMDQSTGEVKAIVGGRGKKQASLTLNRATNTYRQPGSTFKIVSTFAPALDVGGFTLASVQDDAPYNYADGTPVHNYSRTYGGLTTIRTAIMKSLNIVTVKTLTDITPQLGYDYLLNFGFTSLSDSDIVQSLALGGITKGVSNLELTAAYATIANGGVYNEPIFYTQILDHDGNVLIDNTSDSHRVLKETTAYLLTNAMEDVVKSGTGTAVDFGTTAIAGKTGTTTATVDSWFVGYTTSYTCGVWGGYDNNGSLPSTSFTKTLWRAVMSRIHANMSYEEFPVPEGIVKASICKKSGKLAIKGVCSNAPGGSTVYSEIFADGTQPTEYCDKHVSATICNESGLIAGDNCTDTTTRVFLTSGSKKSADAGNVLPTKVCDGNHTSTEETTDTAEDTTDDTTDTTGSDNTTTDTTTPDDGTNTETAE